MTTSMPTDEVAAAFRRSFQVMVDRTELPSDQFPEYLLSQPPRRHRFGWALAAAAAAILVFVGIGLVRNDTPPASEPTVDQMATIERLVDAINFRDVEEFIAAFSPEGEFDPRGDFRATSSLFGNTQPVAQEHLVAAWMSIVDAWGLDADLRGCGLWNEGERWQGALGLPRSGGDSLVVCEVTTGWVTLSMEVVEEWAFELRGDDVLFWAYTFRDLEPASRSMPLGYEGLEEWEAWLEANDPESAARYLNPQGWPRNCDGCEVWQTLLAPDDPELAARLAPLLTGAEKDWPIDGYRFLPAGFIPYDPALAEEIAASVREYLDGR